MSSLRIGSMITMSSKALLFSTTKKSKLPAVALLALRNYNNTMTTFSSDNITYSGGQAIDGQGGFYGSGGARVIKPDEAAKMMMSDAERAATNRQTVLAMQQDIEMVTNTMKEYGVLEQQLLDCTTNDNNSNNNEETASTESIKLKSAIKKLMTSPDLLDSLKRLEIQGEPVWGLSSSERELIMECREKMNEV